MPILRDAKGGFFHSITLSFHARLIQFRKYDTNPLGNSLQYTALLLKSSPQGLFTMMKLHVHPEGIAVLKGFGLLLLFLAAFVLRFSSGPWDRLFAWISSKTDQAMDSPADHAAGHRRKRVKFDQEHWRKTKIAFYWFSGILVAWLLVDSFLLPETYTVGGEWHWPLAISTFFAGLVVIVIGRQVWDGRDGWSKWTFWYALVATDLALLVFTHWMFARLGNLHRARGLFTSVLGGLVLSGFLFLWLFGMLRRIDRNKMPVASVSARDGETNADPPSQLSERSSRARRRLRDRSRD